MSVLPAQANTPVLYSFRRCPYAMRARLALVASEIQVELREIELRAKPAHLIQLSAKATVPVLWLPDGTVIDESLQIMQWALTTNDPHGWFKLQADERETVNALLAQLDGSFKYHLDRYKYASRYNTNSLEHFQYCLVFLLEWEQRLLNHAFILGEHAKFIDYAMLPFVRQLRIADSKAFDARADLPNLHRWLNSYLNSSWYQQIMHQYPVWQPGQVAVFLN